MQFDVIRSDELSKEAQVVWCSSWWRFRLQEPREVTGACKRDGPYSPCKGDVSGAGLFPYRVLVPVPGSCSGGADQEFGCGTVCVGWGTLQ